jgi:hypothetical protein
LKYIQISYPIPQEQVNSSPFNSPLPVAKETDPILYMFSK